MSGRASASPQRSALACAARSAADTRRIELNCRIKSYRRFAVHRQPEMNRRIELSPRAE